MPLADQATKAGSQIAPHTAQLAAWTLTLLAVGLSARLLDLHAAADWLVLLGVGSGSGFVLQAACTRGGRDRMNACGWMLGAGYVGMLGGLLLDSGRSGFLQSLLLCRTQSQDALTSALSSLSNMPMAYVAMAVACHCAMWAREKLLHRSGAMHASRSSFVVLNLGMAGGMALGHGMAMYFAATLPLRAFAAGVLILMLAGMAIGVFPFYRTVERQHGAFG